MECTLQALLAALSQGELRGTDTPLHGVSTDSRRIAAGNLFVALRGEHFDAHDFLPQAAATGAAAVVAEALPDGFGLPALLVPDTKQALLEIGHYWRSRFDLPLIGVTGSNGKTTVKEMLAAILTAACGSEHYLATRGNLNNEIGVPMTLLDLQSRHQAAVIEMGMNHPGEIAVLADCAKPTVVLVNNAQREHQEFMQSVRAVAEENGAAIRALPLHGVAVFPHDDEFSALWRAYANEGGQRRVLSFGLTPGADVHATYVEQGFGSTLELFIDGSAQQVQLQAAGEHNVLNALAAAACAQAIGIAAALIVSGLENFRPVQGRLQRHSAAGGATVIDDTYNANPDSVRAAIDVLAQLGGDTILVLGDMGEVGQQGALFHAEIGDYARARGVGTLFLFGELVSHSVSSFGAGAQHFSDLSSLLAALDARLTEHSTVLVKGSRFMRMERVVAHLLAVKDSQQKITGMH
ncbi:MULTISPECIES: UDP-N-acetylmuramoyl-tripeptide--D-alanyl-D-alanine ligase [unclassified Undibacterium]|uniref:UDP-N-acetylmuramoyl-tripeptide--D-alanyl-D- alanine ligase n=1 Tax=unclassified Undibacterium TaxID=2630295 RepID=UPI002AC926BD|nr:MULTISPECIES: UDP-N-acetylmuramoyl-tripeptide--D-alanyl-D-alanine ligase [unclassified Undibacterium]MEB0138653.1 UDP-N-acetylmuramoyl-tripeptide--D-alanyl-D-alanine ligase [Undibacterium sp. CCC2.1]MEB0171454.1 UDP-N-acetylmuramoyl-tripeptide--D-alanyl-D-alanine ligase [Undibacterium sp. CCC1.1]MEB0175784.1 UDP-N-acetylmuramoyl-tripeptide--D-alanyl-D-alanine ligase [Undibacterium sp. CCC3.4]MEB0214387.1 UDP-N-acetylmuramoyl-tripeptide--D-alanyl-D-alanine ligase [Undibacterium sp. 5I2]WPX44